jgi:cytochrome c oxidase subunit 2
MTDRLEQRRILKIIGLVVIGFCLLATNSFAESEKVIEVKAKKFSYTPNIIKVDKGDRVKIRLISEDVTHGMFIDGYGLETHANPGQDGYISFTADKTGKFAFRCSVTCGEFHPYMIGNLIVGPNTRFYLYLLAMFIIGGGSLLALFLKKPDQNGQR